jgi:hypothetical protein
MKAHTLPLCATLFLSAYANAAPYTPGPGSPERVAIADAVRLAIIRDGAFADDARHGRKFVIQTLNVEGRYAFFEGAGEELADGQYAYGSTAVIAFLEKTADGWVAFHLECRGDVPSEAEVRQIRAEIPSDWPWDLFPSFWRHLLKTGGGAT